MNDLRRMHSNLRILYVLVALTAVTAGVWWFQGGQGELAHIEGTDFAIADTSLVDGARYCRLRVQGHARHAARP